MKKEFKRYALFLMLVAVVILLHFFLPQKANNIFHISTSYLVEMLSILPPVLVLLGLLDAWVPRTIIEKTLGQSSGFKGRGIAVLVGTAAAGPLYVAFPIAVSLSKKGASISNVVIFLCSWAAIKIPMVMFETKFLGFKFSMMRLILTIPSAILIGFIMEKVLVSKEAH